MRIGKITAINFNQFKVKIFSEIQGGSVNICGEVYYFGNIGSYLKTSNPVGETIICEVIAIFDSDQNNTQQIFNIHGNRELLLKPMGTYKEGKFSLGVGIYPSLYSDVNLVKNEDLKEILVLQSKKIYLGISKNLINHPIYIGIDNFFNIHSAVLGNSGSGKSNTIAHILQEIYKKSNPAPKTKIIIFDVNGEYKQAFSQNIKTKIKYFKPNITEKIKYFKPNITEREDYSPFYMPHFLMSLDEWSSFLMTTDATQKPFWDKVLQEACKFYKASTSTGNEHQKYIHYLRYKICVFIGNILFQTDSDTAKMTTMLSLLSNIQDIIKNKIKIGNHSKEGKELIDDIQNLLDACDIGYGKKEKKFDTTFEAIQGKVRQNEIQEIIDTKLKDGEFFHYKFLKIASEMVLLAEETRGNKMIRGYVATMLNRLDYFLENPDCSFMREDTEIKSKKEYFQYLWGEKEENQLVIIDTSELGSDVLETLTCVISRLIFSERKQQNSENRQKNPVHLILDEAHRYIKKDQKYLLKENIFERIAREGRKYALYLLISSQRPSELSQTVLSQCANFIIHRIQNENDMRHINAVLPYFSEDFTNKIKQSIPGEALIFGNCVPMPLHISIHKANPEPNSKNCDISQEWFQYSPKTEK